MLTFCDNLLSRGAGAGFNYPFLTSKERDNETGLDYFEARYFASAQGRFTSTDPILMKNNRIGDPQQLNLYVYARNNPLKYVDPDGEDLILSKVRQYQAALSSRQL